MDTAGPPSGSPNPMPSRRPTWPEGHAFAFTIFDDTDWTTLDNGPVVYEFLNDLGFRITKSVWPLEPDGPRPTGGETCHDADYLEWVLSLREAGHEIGYHNATDRPSTRARTKLALETFRELFGHYPRIGADHAGNSEALYWGSRRVSGLHSNMYSLAQRVLQPRRPSFSGEDPGSPYFWGDLHRRHITYWRNFTFNDTNVLNSCPEMPYHDPDRGYVNWWFAATHAPRRESFVEHLGTERLDRLERDGGACIMYTHLGLDFVEDGALHPDFVRVMTSLAARNGWFAPASDVLDHLRLESPASVLDDTTRRSLERRWILDRLRNSRRLGPRVVTT